MNLDMKKTKSPVQKAKKNAWDAFSRFIRARDCIGTTGDIDGGICVTCGRYYPFKQLQAGHLIAGRTNSVLFDEEAVNIQCFGCNIGRGGAYVEYFIWMENKYGREKIDELRAKRHQQVKYTLFDYERIRKEYEDKYEALLASV